MEETQEISEKPKRGRPRKVVEETALAIPDPEPAVEQVKIKRARKNLTPKLQFKAMSLLLPKRGL